MSSGYRPILGTLGYVLSADKNEVLLLNRSKRANDIHYGKFNGLGGKLHDDEDVVSGMVREIREEAGIEPIDIILRGTINWPGFGGIGEDWFGFIFRIDTWTGDVLKENDEGYLQWVARSTFDQVAFWESDRYWLDMVFDDDPRIFHGHAPFLNGEMISWNFHRL